MHEEETGRGMPLDEGGDIKRMGTSDDGRAEVHLYGNLAVAGQLAEAIDGEVAKCLLRGG